MSLFFDNARVNATRPVSPVVRGNKRAIENQNVNASIGTLREKIRQAQMAVQGPENSPGMYRQAQQIVEGAGDYGGAYKTFLDTLGKTSAPDVGPLLPFTPGGVPNTGPAVAAAPPPTGAAVVPLEYRMQFDEMKANAAAAWQDALNRQGTRTDQAETDRALLLRRLARQMALSNRDTRAGLGGRSMALSPAAMDRAARQLQDSQAVQTADANSQFASVQAQLLNAVNAAAVNKARVDESVNRQLSALRSDPNVLLGNA